MGGFEFAENKTYTTHEKIAGISCSILDYQKQNIEPLDFA